MTKMTVRGQILATLIVTFSLLHLSGCINGDIQGFEGSATIDVAWFSPGGERQNTKTLPHAKVGSPYDLRFVVFDVNPLPPNCAGVAPMIVSGAASGLEINAISDVEKQLLGTPSKAGTSDVKVLILAEAEDNELHCNGVDRTFSLIIDPADLLLSVDTTPQLPDGRVGEMYAATISASGGQTPYTWSATAGDLPGGHGRTATACEGLSADLSLASPPVSGTPVNEGDCVFTLQVTDAVGATASREFTVPVNPVEDGNPGALERVSLSTEGEQGDSNSGSSSGDAHPIAVSQDGRFVVFTSLATNLAPGADNGGNNLTDVFVRDTCRGASAPGDCYKTTSRITGPAAPEPGNDYVDITADGQWIAFASSAPDAGVWVAPRSGGTAVRLTPTDPEVEFSSFINPAISDDGRFVAVQTPLGLVPEDTNIALPDIYLFDRDGDENGAFDDSAVTVTLVSATPSGAAGNGLSADADISADGRYVVFSSVATDLVADSGTASQIYLRDTCIGGGCTATTVLISAGPSEPGDALSLHPRITPDARYVAFDSAATNLLLPGGDTNFYSDIYVHDTCIGGPGDCPPTNIRVTRAFDGGETNESSVRPSISADGRFLAFESQADNLVAGFPSSLFVHVFATDACTGVEGCEPKTNFLSQVDGHPGNSGSRNAVISPDGKFVDFESRASELVTGDTNGVDDIFLIGPGLP